jgi:2-polyprenyl-3-methyl-5-hydroxy-6-metoxy-1,4-benzoquinol methylase
MITQEEFLKAELEMNLTMDNPDFVALAESVLTYVSIYPFTSIIDYGCGTGVYSEIARKGISYTDGNGGLPVYALDIFKTHRDYCKKQYPDLKVIARPVKADLMYFIEVAEHMTDEEIKKAINAIDPNYILFSSTPNTTDWDLDWGHINIKQEPEWVELFKGLGYKVIDKPNTPTTWSLMFQKI